METSSERLENIPQRYALRSRAQRKVTAASGLGPAPSQGTNYCLTLTEQVQHLWSKEPESPFCALLMGDGSRARTRSLSLSG